MRLRRKRYRKKKKLEAKLRKGMSPDSTADICYSELSEMDEQPSFPVNTDTTIHLPDYMTTADKIHVTANFAKAREREEQAKLIAHLHHNQCSKLTTKVAQLQLEEAKLKASFTHEKNQICSFWRDQVLEGKSCSGQI